MNLMEDSRYITAMITPKGLFQLTRVPFGLCSAPASFHRAIEHVISTCPFAKNMLDDIILGGTTKADHDRKLRQVLRALSDARATINFDKSQFGVPTVDFVGFTVSEGGITPLRSNVDSLLKIQAPKNQKELHFFLSTANYYLKFVPKFANVSEPLRKLLRQDVPWEWTASQQKAFELIKEEIASFRV